MKKGTALQTLVKKCLNAVTPTAASDGYKMIPFVVKEHVVSLSKCLVHDALIVQKWKGLEWNYIIQFLNQLCPEMLSCL